MDDTAIGVLDDRSRAPSRITNLDDNEVDPSARVPWSRRLYEWRRHYIPLPEEVIEDYLAEDEYIIHIDHPSFRAFLFRHAGPVAILTIGLPALLMFLLSNGIGAWEAWLLIILLDVVLGFLAIRRLGDRYVSYVITNTRLIRVSGIVSRKLASIAWTRMAGIGYSQSAMGRFLGYATIHLESANEASGLRQFSDVNDAELFHQHLVDMVSGKTGQKEGDTPPPPTKGVRKSLRKRRRERRDRYHGRLTSLRADAEARGDVMAEAEAARAGSSPSSGVGGDGGDGGDDGDDGGGIGPGPRPGGGGGGRDGGGGPGSDTGAGRGGGASARGDLMAQAEEARSTGTAPPDTGGPSEARSTPDPADRGAEPPLAPPRRRRARRRPSDAARGDEPGGPARGARPTGQPDRPGPSRRPPEAFDDAVEPAGPDEPRPRDRRPGGERRVTSPRLQRRDPSSRAPDSARGPSGPPSGGRPGRPPGGPTRRPGIPPADQGQGPDDREPTSGRPGGPSARTGDTPPHGEPELGSRPGGPRARTGDTPDDRGRGPGDRPGRPSRRADEAPDDQGQGLAGRLGGLAGRRGETPMGREPELDDLTGRPIRRRPGDERPEARRGGRRQPGVGGEVPRRRTGRVEIGEPLEPLPDEPDHPTGSEGRRDVIGRLRARLPSFPWKRRRRSAEEPEESVRPIPPPQTRRPPPATPATPTTPSAPGDATDSGSARDALASLGRVPRAQRLRPRPQVRIRLPNLGQRRRPSLPESRQLPAARDDAGAPPPADDDPDNP